jgi:transcriptional regulator with XRE-family HTH domain
MPAKSWRELKKDRLSPEALERVNRAVESEILEMDLRAIRELTGKTQEELAALALMTQSEVSRLERRSDYLVSTLQRIVHALGGELEVIANFGDKRVKLTT